MEVGPFLFSDKWRDNYCANAIGGLCACPHPGKLREIDAQRLNLGALQSELIYCQNLDV